MPYVETAYTDCIYPMKLHEYLASGRPVVATPIRTIREFADFVELARTVDEWSNAIQRNLSADANTDDNRQRRQRIASRYDWDEIVWRIAGIIGKGIRAPLPGESRKTL
jgi:glycosyltransferase involved in cell wall biosynthesis